MNLVPPQVAADIMMLFPEKSAALAYHLGSNPEKTRQILAMNGQQALIELTRLSERLTLKPRGKQLSGAPAVDEPIQVLSWQQISHLSRKKWTKHQARVTSSFTARLKISLKESANGS